MANDRERRFALKVERHGKQILEAQAASGDSMLALGRVRQVDGPAFEAAGPDGLLLFTSPAGSAPRRILTRHLGRHYLGLGGLLVAMAAKFCAAFWLG